MKTAFAIGLSYEMSVSISPHLEKRTVANILPNFRVRSTTFSSDGLISGKNCPITNGSSSWSNERRASVYAKIISGPRWPVAKKRTVVFAENRNSRSR